MSSQSCIRVAVAQIDTRFGALAENLAKHLDFIAQARQQAVDVLVFPETSLSGFPHRPVHDHALRRDGAEIQRLADACGPLAAVIGFVEEAPAAQFYNSCVVLREGQTLHIHRKLNLATYGSLEEGKYFAQGRYVDTFDLPRGIWRVCTLICADVWNPALVHLAALHGATMLVVPTNSAEDAVSSEFSNPEGWDLAARFYAMIYGMPLIMANRVGAEAGLSFWGGSRVIDPFGQIVVQAEMAHEALITADIDYAAVRRARVQLPTVRDSNLALVHREIARLEQSIGVPANVRRY